MKKAANQNLDPKFKEFRVDIIKKEIDYITTKSGHLDNLRLKTRQLAIFLWTGTVGFGLKENTSWLFLLAIIIPLPFWFIDASYRRYYRGHYVRLKAIRDLIRDGKYKVKGENTATLEQFLSDDKESDFPVFDFWGRKTLPEEEHSKEVKFVNNFFSRRILLIYGAMFIVGIILLLLKGIGGSWF